MTENTAQKRLQLVKNIREEHARNQLTMRRREDILYGHHSSYSYDTPAYSPYSLPAELTAQEGEEPPVSVTSFKVRFLIAIGLFLAFLIMDVNHTHILGINMNTLYSYLTQDMTANSFDFIDDLTYTLDNASADQTK